MRTSHIVALVIGLLSTFVFAAEPANPLDTAKPPATNPLDTAKPKRAPRPPCPKGWAILDNPLVGMQAYVPPGYMPRLKENAMLSIEKLDGTPTAVYMLPFFLQKPVKAPELAEKFGAFYAQSDKNLKPRLMDGATDDRAVLAYTSQFFGQDIEGRCCILVSAGGSMAFAIGMVAPKGKLEAMMPELQSIAEGLGFHKPKGKWVQYASPRGGFTGLIPEGWQVRSNDAQTGKSDIDVAFFDPKQPAAQAFNLAPRYCSQVLFQAGGPGNIYQVHGYTPVPGFQNHQQIATVSIGQLFPNAKVTVMAPNAQLTQLAQAGYQRVNQILQGLQAGGLDVAIYNCAATAQGNGKEVQIVFLMSLRNMTVKTAWGPAMDIEVGIRGWSAPADEFVSLTPVLDRIQSNFAHTPQFIMKVVQGNEQAAKIIMETYAYMNKIDRQITRDHWKTMDAIAEMYHDLWTDQPALVNEKSGKIEKMDPDKIIRNASGEPVSREEVQAGVNPNSATVLREAYSQDYIDYGRLIFR